MSKLLRKYLELFPDAKPESLNYQLLSTNTPDWESFYHLYQHMHTYTILHLLNCNPPYSFIRFCSNYDDIDILKSIASMQVLPIDVLSSLMSRSNHLNLYILQHSPHVDYFFNFFSTFSEPQLIALSKNIHLKPSQISILSCVNCFSVRANVAKNLNTPIPILLQLSTDINPFVRKAVSQNPNSTADVLKNLLYDTYYDVCINVCLHPNCTKEIFDVVRPFRFKYFSLFTAFPYSSQSMPND